MKKNKLKTILATLCLSCTLLTGTLPTQAVADTVTADTATAPTTTDNVKKPSTARTNIWKIKKGRHYYYNAQGKKVTGKVKIGSRYYYFDKNGVQRYGWQKIKGNYYFFRISAGTTGAYMVTSATVNGIHLDSSGRASKSGTNARKLNLMVTANKIVEKICKPGMKKWDRLRTSFNYVKKHYPYYTWRQFRNTSDWEKDFAEDMFVRGRGDCISYAAAFAYMANAVGMKNVYVICSGGHGWAEIGGKVYDPDWALVSNVDSYFAMPYSLSGVNGRPLYKTNRVYVKKI